MDNATLLAVTDFSRMRLLAILDSIEKAAPENTTRVLAWRPAVGRAHIAWQAMHCAATHDRYLNVSILGGEPNDSSLVTAFAGGSVPSDENVPSLATIRAVLAKNIEPLRKFITELSATESERKVGSGKTVGESVVLLAWHEAHHQGQIHLTWNLYKQAHGIK